MHVVNTKYDLTLSVIHVQDGEELSCSRTFLRVSRCSTLSGMFSFGSQLKLGVVKHETFPREKRQGIEVWTPHFFHVHYTFVTTFIKGSSF